MWYEGQKKNSCVIDSIYATFCSWIWLVCLMDYASKSSRICGLKQMSMEAVSLTLKNSRYTKSYLHNIEYCLVKIFDWEFWNHLLYLSYRIYGIVHVQITCLRISIMDLWKMVIQSPKKKPLVSRWRMQCSSLMKWRKDCGQMTTLFRIMRVLQSVFCPQECSVPGCRTVCSFYKCLHWWKQMYSL